MSDCEQLPIRKHHPPKEPDMTDPSFRDDTALASAVRKLTDGSAGPSPEAVAALIRAHESPAFAAAFGAEAICHELAALRGAVAALAGPTLAAETTAAPGPDPSTPEPCEAVSGALEVAGWLDRGDDFWSPDSIAAAERYAPPPPAVRAGPRAGRTRGAWKMTTTLLSDETRKARKRYCCQDCHALILVGEEHSAQSYAYDGRAYTWRSCLPCRALAATVGEWCEWPEEGFGGEDYYAWAQERPDDERAVAYLTRMERADGCSCNGPDSPYRFVRMTARGHVHRYHESHQILGPTGDYVAGNYEDGGIVVRADRDYIAAVDPTTVLALIERVRTVEAEPKERCEAETPINDPYGSDPTFWLRCVHDEGHDGPHHADDGDYEREWGGDE